MQRPNRSSIAYLLILYLTLFINESSPFKHSRKVRNNNNNQNQISSQKQLTCYACSSSFLIRYDHQNQNKNELPNLDSNFENEKIKEFLDIDCVNNLSTVKQVPCNDGYCITTISKEQQNTTTKESSKQAFEYGIDRYCLRLNELESNWEAGYQKFFKTYCDDQSTDDSVAASCLANPQLALSSILNENQDWDMDGIPDGSQAHNYKFTTEDQDSSLYICNNVDGCNRQTPKFDPEVLKYAVEITELPPYWRNGGKDAAAANAENGQRKEVEANTIQVAGLFQKSDERSGAEVGGLFTLKTIGIMLLTFLGPYLLF